MNVTMTLEEYNDLVKRVASAEAKAAEAIASGPFFYVTEPIPFEQLKARYFQTVVDKCGGNQTKAARLIKVHRQSFIGRLK